MLDPLPPDIRLERLLPNREEKIWRFRSRRRSRRRARTIADESACRFGWNI